MEIKYRRRREEGKIAAGMSGKSQGIILLTTCLKKEIYNTCKSMSKNTCIV